MNGRDTMTNQRQLLTLGLVVFVFLAGGGALGYFLFLQPIGEKEQAAARLERETEEQDAKLAGLRKNLSRLADARRRSLPADEQLAAREYNDVLLQILQQSKAPLGYTVKPRTVDNKSAPSLAGPPAGGTVPIGAPANPNAKKAYTRVAFEVSIPKADLWTLIDFLRAYYKLNLLQQITSFSVKKADDATATAARRGSRDEGDRKDLNVTIVTEALILDGAEQRRSVLPVPTAFAAVGGWAGQQAVSLTPEAGRRITPQQFTPVLANRPPRDYSVMVAKDPFHGPLPPPPPVAPPVVVNNDPPPKKVKPDISPYIRLVGITQRDDGSAAAEVRDLMNNTEYEVHYSPLRVEVRRYTGTTSRRQPDKNFKPSDVLAIWDDDSSTVRNYRVVAVESDALFVTDAKEQAAAAPPAALAGVVGGGANVVAAAPPQPKMLRWKLGQSLKEVTNADEEEIGRILTPPADGGSVAHAR